MIFYYSGTGNTRHCASRLAEALGESLVEIPSLVGTPYKEGKKHPGIPWPELAEGERIGFMFPIYSWGIPPIVGYLLSVLPQGYLSGHYAWGACTCGDEAGIAMRLFSRKIRKNRGHAPQAVWSIIMPNDYVLLPGFDVDSTAVAQSKIEKSEARLTEIAAKISAQEEGIFDVHEGSLPALRTRLTFPLFKKWGINPKRWHVDTDRCIRCGKCSRACPIGNIADTPPRWEEHCLSCCACFHICPVRAIDYGHFTQGKGQYFYPGKQEK